MKKIIFFWIAAPSCYSCSMLTSLNSNTSIDPKGRFVLGNDLHGPFKLQLQNVSDHHVSYYLLSNNTILQDSRKILDIGQSCSLKVPRNIGIVIENTAEKKASINLKANGDLNLSMTYTE